MTWTYGMFALDLFDVIANHPRGNVVLLGISAMKL